MGKLFDLVMLDTRNYDRSITTLGQSRSMVMNTDKKLTRLTRLE